MDRIGPAGGSPLATLTNGSLGFQDENLSTGVEGTEVVSAFLNAFQEELMTILAAAGLTPNIGNFSQVLQAINILSANFIMISSTPGASGSFIVPGGKNTVFLLAQGAGGGGQSGPNATAGAGEGGQAGGFAISINDVTPGQSISYVVGSGGATDTLGGSSGIGGLFAGGGNVGSGGGASYGGLINITGGIGSLGDASGTIWTSGRGGGSIFGDGGVPVQGNASSGFVGNPSLAFGGGGSGGTDSGAGGVGGGGLVAMWG